MLLTFWDCKMGTEQRIESVSALSNSHVLELQTKDKCSNCVKMEERLISVLQDLKTAETIISILPADSKFLSESTMRDESNPNSTKWSLVKCKNSDRSYGKTQNITNLKCNSVCTNRFAPLDFTEELQDDKSTISYKGQILAPTRQHGCGSKIPTIVNGVVNISKDKKPSKSKNSATPPIRSQTAKSRHVRIIGDSHLKGTAAKLKLYLNSQFSVTSIIKPGAKTNKLLDNQQEDLKSLGKKDFLVISTGANDLDDPTTNINNTVVPLMTFISNLEHTNVTTVNTPYCHDLGHDPVSINKKKKDSKAK